MSRRELARLDHFDELSPDVGELDEQVLSELLADSPDAALALLADAARATDPRLRRLARDVAGRVVVDIARRGRVRAGGVGLLASRPYEPGASDPGELDVDASLEALSERRRGGAVIDIERLRVRRWTRPTTAMCLLVDSSGSMHGRPVATAAVGAAAIAMRAPRAYAIASFSSSVLVLKAIEQDGVAVERVVDDVLSLRGHGTTDLAASLGEAARQLRRARASRRVTVLLSDCRANAPGDVTAAASALDELLIVAPDHDDVAARQLADQTGGRVATVDGPTDIAAALTHLLS